MTKNAVKRLLDKDQQISLANLRHISSADMASLLLELEERKSDRLFQYLLDTKLAVSVLSEMQEPHLKLFLSGLPKQKRVKLFSEGQTDDLIYLLGFIEDSEIFLNQLSLKQKLTLKKFMAYPQDSSGRIMQDDFFALRPEFLVEQGIEKLREYSREKFVHYIYVTDKANILVGVLSIRQLAISLPQTRIEKIINTNIVSIRPWQSDKEAADMVSRHNFIALPVTDDKNKILGLITVDDVLDIIEEEGQAKVYAMAGLPEDDRIYTSSSQTIKNRLPWLSLNLLFAILASSIISLFEQTMSRLIILATLKNVVAGIGGNTAIQTLTVTARGLDTGDFHFTSFSKALSKELFAGFIMGCALGLGAALITYFWKNSFLVAGIIFFSMVLNSLIAVLAGFVTPVLIRKLKKDPAVSSGVIVTVLTDIFGFFIFLALASACLNYFGESL